MKNLLSAVEDNFGKCDVTLEHVNKLTNYVIYNLSLLNKLNEYIIQNIDYMEKSQADIITNILVCLGYKMEGYWPAVSAQLEKDGFSEQESFLKELNLELLFKDSSHNVLIVQSVKFFLFSSDNLFSTIFFKEGYLIMYEDVANDPIYSKDPMKHYKDIGKKEGRDNGLHPTLDIFNHAQDLKNYTYMI